MTVKVKVYKEDSYADVEDPHREFTLVGHSETFSWVNLIQQNLLVRVDYDWDDEAVIPSFKVDIGDELPEEVVEDIVNSPVLLKKSDYEYNYQNIYNRTRKVKIHKDSSVELRDVQAIRFRDYSRVKTRETKSKYDPKQLDE